MRQRVPGSMRTRHALSDLITGRLSSPDGWAELVKLAMRRIVEGTLEAESRDALGQDYYGHGAEPGSGYRNGVRTGRLRTAEGLVEDSAPQIAGRDELWRSEIRERLKGRTRALEDLALGALGPRPVGSRHRGRLSRRERTAAPVARGGLGARRAAVGRLPGVRRPRPERARHRLSVRRRHCRAHPAGEQARAGDGGPGLHLGRGQGPASPDGGFKGGRRDGGRVLPGQARPRPW